MRWGDLSYTQSDNEVEEVEKEGYAYDLTRLTKWRWLNKPNLKGKPI